MAETNFFNDIPDQPIGETGNINGLDYLDNVSAIRIGAGTKSFKADESGIWLGAKKFVDAPFSVDMDGNIIATTLALGGYMSKTDTGQSFTGSFTLGTANITIDGANKRIVINDGTNDRILIGYQSGGF